MKQEKKRINRAKMMAAISGLAGLSMAGATTIMTACGKSEPSDTVVHTYTPGESMKITTTNAKSVMDEAKYYLDSVPEPRNLEFGDKALTASELNSSSNFLGNGEVIYYELIYDLAKYTHTTSNSSEVQFLIQSDWYDKALGKLKLGKIVKGPDVYDFLKATATVNYDFVDGKPTLNIIVQQVYPLPILKYSINSTFFQGYIERFDNLESPSSFVLFDRQLTSDLYNNIETEKFDVYRNAFQDSKYMSMNLSQAIADINTNYDEGDDLNNLHSLVYYDLLHFISGNTMLNNFQTDTLYESPLFIIGYKKSGYPYNVDSTQWWDKTTNSLINTAILFNVLQPNFNDIKISNTDQTFKDATNVSNFLWIKCNDGHADIPISVEYIVDSDTNEIWIKLSGLVQTFTTEKHQNIYIKSPFFSSNFGSWTQPVDEQHIYGLNAIVQYEDNTVEPSGAFIAATNYNGANTLEIKTAFGKGVEDNAGGFMTAASTSMIVPNALNATSSSTLFGYSFDAIKEKQTYASYPSDQKTFTDHTLPQNIKKIIIDPKIRTDIKGYTSGIYHPTINLTQNTPNSADGQKYTYISGQNDVEYISINNVGAVYWPQNFYSGYGESIKQYTGVLKDLPSLKKVDINFANLSDTTYRLGEAKNRSFVLIGAKNYTVSQASNQQMLNLNNENYFTSGINGTQFIKNAPQLQEINITNKDSVFSYNLGYIGGMWGGADSSTNGYKTIEGQTFVFDNVGIQTLNLPTANITNDVTNGVYYNLGNIINNSPNLTDIYLPLNDDEHKNIIRPVGWLASSSLAVACPKLANVYLDWSNTNGPTIQYMFTPSDSSKFLNFFNFDWSANIKTTNGIIHITAETLTKNSWNSVNDAKLWFQSVGLPETWNVVADYSH